MGDDGGARRSGPAINLPIAEVAAQCGYNNARYFSKLFRQETGATPNEYREHRRKNRS
jgi:two-component system response regulator YesN